MDCQICFEHTKLDDLELFNCCLKKACTTCFSKVNRCPFCRRKTIYQKPDNKIIIFSGGVNWCSEEKPFTVSPSILVKELAELITGFPGKFIVTCNSKSLDQSKTLTECGLHHNDNVKIYYSR